MPENQPHSTAAFAWPDSDHTLTADDILSAAEVAELLGVPKSTVDDWARRGIIPSRKRGKRRFFLRWEILDWLTPAEG